MSIFVLLWQLAAVLTVLQSWLGIFIFKNERCTLPPAYLWCKTGLVKRVCMQAVLSQVDRRINLRMRGLLHKMLYKELESWGNLTKGQRQVRDSNPERVIINHLVTFYEDDILTFLKNQCYPVLSFCIDTQTTCLRYINFGLAASWTFCSQSFGKKNL